jgi:CO/xanthine dehydrogenase Mo-binding subunit
VSKLTCESQVNGGIIMGIGCSMKNRHGPYRRGAESSFKPTRFSARRYSDIDVVLLDMPDAA